MSLLWLFVLTAVASWLLTGFFCRYVFRTTLIDIPNARSSHSVPTPRGGGVAIVIIYLIGLSVLWRFSQVADEAFIALFGAGLLVASIGFIDDYGHIAARWRLLSHFCAAFWLLFWLDGLPPLSFFSTTYDLGFSGYLLASIALVWLLNLYNFMDGIDGIAGVEALSSTLVAGLLLLLVAKNQDVASIYFLMAAAVSGFLIWNFPPAKIFMGDAGSGFLGLMLGAFALYSSHILPQMLWAWLILLGVFIVDATYTLIRRLLRGDKVYVAHRSHAYQYASRKYGSHKVVTLAVLVINLCWLTPLAVFVAYGVIDGVVGMSVAYMPLLWLALHYNAGALEKA